MGRARAVKRAVWRSGMWRTDDTSVSDDLAMASAAEHSVTAPFAGVVVAIPRELRERVGADTPLVVLEAMKMEHEVLALVGGVVASLEVAVGDAVEEGQLLARIVRRCASATRSVWTPRARRRWPAGTSAGGAQRERTSRTCSTLER